MLEQAAVAEAVTNARLERVQRLRQRHDDAAADLLAVAVDDPYRFGGVGRPHRNLGLAERVERERKQARRGARRAHGLDAMAVEQSLDHVGFDVGLRAEDHGEAVVHHASVPAPIGTGAGRSIFIRIIVMSSC